MNQLFAIPSCHVASKKQLQSYNSDTAKMLAYEIDDSIDLLRKTKDEVLIEYALLNLEHVRNSLREIVSEGVQKR